MSCLAGSAPTTRGFSQDHRYQFVIAVALSTLTFKRSSFAGALQYNRQIEARLQNGVSAHVLRELKIRSLNSAPGLLQPKRVVGEDVMHRPIFAIQQSEFVEDAAVNVIHICTMQDGKFLRNDAMLERLQIRSRSACGDRADLRQEDTEYAAA